MTAGSTVTLTVVATGTAPLSYQWLKDGVAISGATSASYTIAGVTSASAGNYSVAVTNAGGTVTSTAATLAVNPAAYLSNLSVRNDARPARKPSSSASASARARPCRNLRGAVTPARLVTTSPAFGAWPGAR